jgi:hypothetical protein
MAHLSDFSRYCLCAVVAVDQLGRKEISANNTLRRSKNLMLQFREAKSQFDFLLYSIYLLYSRRQTPLYSHLLWGVYYHSPFSGRPTRRSAVSSFLRELVGPC